VKGVGGVGPPWSRICGEKMVRRNWAGENARGGGPARCAHQRCRIISLPGGPRLSMTTGLPVGVKSLGYCICQWQLINYWDDCHLELIPRPSSATEMNFQSVFECENACS
jgi:hypothetical protein